MKLKLAFLLFLCPIINGYAQALKPGNQLNPTIEANLNTGDYNDRLLILDFWASSCVSCIESMPKLAELQQQFGKRLQVILVDYEKTERVARFFHARPDLEAYHLPIITQDTIFKKLFVHQYLPHIVWINKGRYITATGEDYINTKTVDSLLNLNSINAQQKNDVIGFDYSKAIYPIDNNSAVKSNVLNSSIFGNHIEGLPPAASISRDSLNGTRRNYVINYPADHLYALALNSGLPLQPNRRIMPGNIHFSYKTSDGYYEDWARKFTYTYEFTSAFTASDTAWRQELLCSLNQNFHMKGRIENRNVSCYIITGHAKASTKQRLIRKDPSSAYIALQHVNGEDLAYILNSQEGLPPVFNSIRDDVSFDIPVTHPISSREDWLSALKSQGITLKAVNKTIPMFILSTL